MATEHTANAPDDEPAERLNFIEVQVEADLRAGKNGGRLHTRFPPEPNGYLHIGHAKAICVNFGLAEQYAGRCNLRFDDTNPSKEEQEYVDGMREDIAWLGFSWGDREYFASDYFPKLYEWACDLIRAGLAYVDDQSVEEIRAKRGSGHAPGVDSPFRARSAEENLALFAAMRAGEFPDGAKVLRAKIDMAAANMNMRDPVLYRIQRAHHHRTGDEWCIYPLYDFAHGQSDAIEGITHSLCSLEFENHRPLYEWFLDHLDVPYRPRQIEFARLELEYTITSKRKLQQLVSDGFVSGWDDPRMPTLRGLRRRGYTPQSIRTFIDDAGVAKFNGTIPLVKLENALRDELNLSAERRMAVLRPLKVVIEDWPAEQVVERQAINNPEDESAGTRPVHLGRELWIERDDFMEDPPKKYFRLQPGGDVRLRYGCVITCREVVKDASGEVVELRCTHDPETYDGKQPADRKVKGVIHWVSAHDAVRAEVRLYDNLFREPAPLDVPEGESFTSNLNPDSLEVVTDAVVERALAAVEPGQSYQFERLGYFVPDSGDHSPSRPVFNRSVSLRDSWSKQNKS
ncbi:glutamine--tRNA ligase/YqeY domain fusion protein [Engelhardtia mirabilis]|uniref:Glutamine--tRNA ligase n=1 Tax=Engelhardtia mirabilis TaxID=2528011 RepID=A0A518BSB0_9BACT|nr:Glutamine--tRNA ligase [Planctomycetes bacterium Pla133]QDV04185.1 Glutamine--tRNA ligase [Planctomycetes bacterium Pla86]